jgi:hypothetical protein
MIVSTTVHGDGFADGNSLFRLSLLFTSRLYKWRICSRGGVLDCTWCVQRDDWRGMRLEFGPPLCAWTHDAV